MAILLAFLLLALATSVFVSRALQGQIGEFLSAARRLAKGDFEHPVPTHGSDEFAALGNEFNTMSDQLAAYIEELETKRRELEDTIRRIGEAFASGLDRQGVVELMVRTAVDACEADAGRALPMDRDALDEIHSGDETEELITALEAAERKAFAVTPESATKLLEPGDTHDVHKPFEASVNGVHALAIPMRARLGARSYAQHVGRRLDRAPRRRLHGHREGPARVPHRPGDRLDRERRPPRDGAEAGRDRRAHRPLQRALAARRTRPRDRARARASTARSAW